MRGVPWHERFCDPYPISAEAGFRLTAARDAESGRDCVVASALRRAESAQVRRALEIAFRAHSTIQHPVIAPVSDLDVEAGYIVFDCPARLDLAGLLATARGPRPRVGHAAADGFICALREALVAAADHEDPRDGGPWCIGTIGYANVLFGLDGRFWLVGLGHNLALADEYGNIGGRSTAFRAPEIAVGARPTLSSDYVSLLLLSRSLVSFIEPNPAIIRVLASNGVAQDVELAKKLVWFERRVIGAVPQERASVDEAMTVSERIRQLLGVTSDPDAFRSQISAILCQDPRFGARATWRFASDGSFVDRGDGARARVSGRGPLRRVALALATARVERPGDWLDLEEIFATGWPGARISQRSVRNRVHVALSTLRKLAFSNDLESHGRSYRISPAVAVEFVDPDVADISAQQ
jgi:hypothetical protein